MTPTPVPRGLDHPDGNAALGLLVGLLCAVPLWGLLVLLLWWVWR